MIKYRFLSCLLAMAPLFWACDTNDQLEELGAAAEQPAPNVFLYSLPASTQAAANLDITTEYWTLKDNMKGLDYMQRITRTRTYKITLGTSLTITKEEKGDWAKIGEKKSDFLADWQTVRSAYVSKFSYLVPTELAESKLTKVDQLSETLPADQVADVVKNLVAKQTKASLQNYYVTQGKLISQTDFNAWYDAQGALTDAGLAQMTALTNLDVLEALAKSYASGAYEHTNIAKLGIRTEAENAFGKRNISVERTVSVGVLATPVN